MDNEKTCMDIAETLDQIADGILWVDRNGDYHVADIDWGQAEERDWEPVGPLDYFENNLGIEYRCDSNKDYLSVQICVAWGGPNIYVDTGSKQVELYWWGSSAKAPLSERAVEMIDRSFEELYTCT